MKLNLTVNSGPISGKLEDPGVCPHCLCKIIPYRLEHRMMRGAYKTIQSNCVARLEPKEIVQVHQNGW